MKTAKNQAEDQEFPEIGTVTNHGTVVKAYVNHPVYEYTTDTGAIICFNFTDEDEKEVRAILSTLSEV